jgi:hypothetical protein
VGEQNVQHPVLIEARFTASNSRAVLCRAPDRIGSLIAAAMGDVKPSAEGFAGEGANVVPVPRGKAGG